MRVGLDQGSKAGEILAEAPQTGTVVRVARCQVQPQGARRRGLRWVPAHAEIHQRWPGHAREPLAGRPGRTHMVAVSSGEAEYYGVVKGMCEALGIKGIAKDMGLDLSITLCTDSSAAKRIATRKRLGKVRHLETQTLRVQEKIDEGKVAVKKIGGDRNVADILTMYLTSLRLRSLLADLTEMEGRHSVAPRLQVRMRKWRLAKVRSR